MDKTLADRIRTLQQKDVVDPKSVIYVMSRDQRVKDNHALLAAQHEAIEYELPLIVVFNVLPQTGVRAREHYMFMLNGLTEVKSALRSHDISFAFTYGNADQEIVSFANIYHPRAVYFDFNPLFGVRSMQKVVAQKLDCSVHVVDTHNVIPVWVVSNKREFAAHTMRRKIHRLLEDYMVEPPKLKKHPYTLSKQPGSLTLESIHAKIVTIDACGIKHTFESGEHAAAKKLTAFIETALESYAVKRNNIVAEGQSGLSPYLHYGQLSSLRVALEVLYAVDERPLLFEQAKMAQSGDTPNKLDGMNALLEEMIVRKELSDNYCLFTEAYTNIKSAEPWAQTTLEQHIDDPREHIYSKQQLENAQTNDEAWNAAQREMTQTGKMHGYMRMYWAKKVLEWSKTPQEAIDVCVYLNDHYSIDGGDPNGYVGIMWSIAGIHDRPWTERPIFGKIRYMNQAGLRRKFDVDAYIRKWEK